MKFGVCIDCLGLDQALALGALRDDVPFFVQVFTKCKYKTLH